VQQNGSEGLLHSDHYDGLEIEKQELFSIHYSEAKRTPLHALTMKIGQFRQF
jgi:hypothetical protein